jgi:hypothetical protein
MSYTSGEAETSELTEEQNAALRMSCAHLVIEVTVALGVNPSRKQLGQATDLMHEHQLEVARTGVLDTDKAYGIGVDVRHVLQAY